MFNRLANTLKSLLSFTPITEAELSNLLRLEPGYLNMKFKLSESEPLDRVTIGLNDSSAPLVLRSVV